MIGFTKEHLARIATDTPSVFKAPTCGTLAINLARFALELMERAETAEAERDEANDERDDAVDRWSRRAREAEAACKELLQVQADRDRLEDLLRRINGLDEKADAASWQQQAEDRETLALQIAAERDRLREELREAEKRMKAWGCPDFDFICLNCGRETPCMTEADLRPGDPGVPCTFDLTYPQMIERLRHYEDRQRKAEAERDEARALKVPATTEAVTLAEMGEMVARTEAWAAKEELRIAEAERDRLQRALDLSEQAHREVREVCERHGVENALRLSVRLESVCDERDRLRAQLDSILANSDSLESGKLADAHADNARLREELREVSGAIIWLAAVKMFNAVPPDQVLAAITRARERAGRG